MDDAPFRTCRSVSFWVPGPPHGKQDTRSTNKVRYRDKVTGEMKHRHLKFPIHYTPTDTRLASKGVAQLGQAAMRKVGLEPFRGPVLLAITATFLPPAGWSDRDKRDAVWHTSKPDGPNILELVADAGSKPKKRGLAAKAIGELRGILWEDDAQLSVACVRKAYGTAEGLLVTVAELDPGSFAFNASECQGVTWDVGAAGMLLRSREQLRLDGLRRDERDRREQAPLGAGDDSGDGGRLQADGDRESR